MPKEEKIVVCIVATLFMGATSEMKCLNEDFWQLLAARRQVHLVCTSEHHDHCPSYLLQYPSIPVVITESSVTRILPPRYY
jgi:hypothetical protein